jgi:hypothetical protein
MADKAKAEEKTKEKAEEKTEAAPAEAAPAEAAPPPAEAKKSGDSLDMGDDLFDLFTDDDEIDEALALLAASLDDVDINDLLEQVRDIQNIMDERRG